MISGPVEKDPKATGAAAKDTNIAVVRFDATGKPDPAFGKGGTALIDIGAGKAVGESYVADNSWGMAALAGGRAGRLRFQRRRRTATTRTTRSWG